MESTTHELHKTRVQQEFLIQRFFRALVLIAFSPVLVRIGYGLNWQNGVVIMWGGLRGAVGLALALQVAIDHPEVGGKVRCFPN